MYKIIILLSLVILVGCSHNRTAESMKTEYLYELAKSADQIVDLSKNDQVNARLKAKNLQEKMCAYVSGLESAGIDGKEIQKHIDIVGERLGAAFSLLSE